VTKSMVEMKDGTWSIRLSADESVPEPGSILEYQFPSMRFVVLSAHARPGRDVGMGCWEPACVGVWAKVAS